MPSSLIDPDLLDRFGDAAAGVRLDGDRRLGRAERTAVRESLRDDRRALRALGPLREAALIAAPGTANPGAGATCAGIVASGAEALGLGLGDPRVRRLFRLLASAEETDRG